MKKEKKQFIIRSVLMFVILFLTFGIFALPASAALDSSCPPLGPRTMIKVMGSPAIYVLNISGQALYFPSGNEFKSWRPAYGGYTLVSQACFESIAVPASYPGGINYHPGSVIVKRPASDQLYVVEPGNTLAKITSSSARMLYGSNFKTVLVADQFWQNYVNRGADVTAKPHPGMLIKIGEKIFYITSDNMAREVTAAGFAANDFQLAFVHAGTDSWIAGLIVGPSIDSEINSITDMTQTSSAAPVVLPISLAPSSGGTGGSGGQPPVATPFDRDQLRIMQLQTLSAALQSFFAHDAHYPSGTNVVLGVELQTCLNSDGWNPAEDCPYPYLALVPRDPQSSSYLYTAALDNNGLESSYEIDAVLEGTINSLHGSIKVTPAGISNR
jgi:hypothetical protein